MNNHEYVLKPQVKNVNLDVPWHCSSIISTMVRLSRRG